jgi:heme/copper-type cytochrome/quinol oxidase subunit 2
MGVVELRGVFDLLPNGQGAFYVLCSARCGAAFSSRQR